MFELKFGMIWEAIVLIISVAFLSDIVAGGEEAIALIPISLFLLLFHGIGIFLLFVGIKKVVANRKTEKYGEECFGKIIDIHPNGNSVNGRKELAAVISVFIPTEGQSRDFKEVVGMGTSPYEIGDYIKGKFFNNDVNIMEKVYPDYLPVNVRNALEVIPTSKPLSPRNAPDVIYVSEDIILVDGVRYQKIK